MPDLGLTDTDLVECVVDFLLNKLEGMEPWHYHQVSFDEPGEAALIHGFTRNGSRFRWRDEAPPPAARDLLRSVLAVLDEHPEVAKRAFQRIFDLDAIPNESGAEKGPLGYFNRKESEARRRRLVRSLRDGRCRGALSVVAEGDSWFQYPPFRAGPVAVHFVRDLIDHLGSRRDLCVQSVAAGGDWLAAMLHSREYVDELSAAEPDVFLFSGGGNDLLGGGRAANMVMHRRRKRTRLEGHLATLLDTRRESLSGESYFDAGRYAHGLHLLAEEFFHFMNLLFVQYYLFLRGIRRARRFDGMALVTQGYDFAIPTQRSTAPRVSPRRFLNHFTGSGTWLWVPLERKRLDDREKQDAAYAMVMEFNELLVSLVSSGRLGRVAHVDARGLASPSEWYDEIHLTSAAFGRVARLYALAIRDLLEDRLSGGRGGGVYGAAQLARAEARWGDPLPVPGLEPPA
jgi:hypothetical protein